jgi:dTDP-4-dehydrorhamnose reductase
MTAKILVTGRSGQLATALGEVPHSPDLAVCRIGRPVLDFDRLASIREVFAANEPSVVVNAAAYTAVDAAEDDETAAFRANRDAPAELARLCEAAGIPLVHISTDYVFDGRKGAPYVETDVPAPQSVYGASKLAGEQAVLAECSRAVILRTSWVYSPVGKNFVRTMLAASERNRRLRVVADQTGCPTSAPDLAQVILRIAARLSSGWEDGYTGIYNAAGTGDTTWHGLATAIFAVAVQHGHGVPEVEPITTYEWQTRAARPPDSRLDCGKLASTFHQQLPPWQDGLARTVDAIFAAQARNQAQSGASV